jgi:hypothetical protein
MIQRDESKLCTLSQICRKITDAMTKLSEYEKAKLRVSLRKHYGLPEQREKALEN